jgi:hypothetical protein
MQFTFHADSDPIIQALEAFRLSLCDELLRRAKAANNFQINAKRVGDQKKFATETATYSQINNWLEGIKFTKEERKS